MATTTWANTAKVELMTATHNFAATVTTSTNKHSNTTLDSIASTAGICVGAVVSGTGITTGTVVSRITSNVALQIDVVATDSGTGASLTYTHDTFYICLIKTGATGAYDKTLTNYGSSLGVGGAPSTSNIGTDEQGNTGTYNAGGFALTNVAPALSTDTATTSFSPNPSWTSASINCIAAVIFNNSKRQGHASTGYINRVVSVHDLGGPQSVSNGSLTLTMPTNNASSAILRVA